MEDILQHLFFVKCGRSPISESANILVEHIKRSGLTQNISAIAVMENDLPETIKLRENVSNGLGKEIKIIRNNLVSSANGINARITNLLSVCYSERDILIVVASSEIVPVIVYRILQVRKIDYQKSLTAKKSNVWYISLIDKEN